MAALVKIYEELEFKSFVAKLAPQKPAPAVDEGLFGIIDEAYESVSDMQTPISAAEIDYVAQELTSPPN